MVSFETLLNDIGDNLGSYAKGTWYNYLAQAQATIEELGGYDFPEDKKTTLLAKNLQYIKKSTSIINHQDDDAISRGQAEFTFYNGEFGDFGAYERDSKPILAKPNDDTRQDVRDGFYKPDIPETSYMFQGNKIDSYYGEYETGAPEHIAISMDMDKNNGETLDNYVGFGLVDKTNRWMRQVMQDEENAYVQDRFQTIISRFHTDVDLVNANSSSAGSDLYGLSHGRNLLKTDSEGNIIDSDGNGYENPYCRVWTWHHQYHNYVKDAMRPFITQDEDGDTALLTQKGLSDNYNWSAFRSPEDENGLDGGSRLAMYGSMYDNGGKTTGMVNITPSWEEGTPFDSADNVNLKHCMFSIENLAWKGLFDNYDDNLTTYQQIKNFNKGLSREQKGPLGGRIMWFPPYDIKFNEHTEVQWEQNVFIGRGEPMYTYSNANRGGTLSFKLLIDHPAILDYWERRNEVPVTNSNVDDVTSKEQELLRFFAGCSILKAKVPEYKKPEPKPIPPEPEPKPVIKKVDNLIQFFVFYPNNYSGKDDKIGGEVDPIEYLLNGIGTQQYFEEVPGKYLDARNTAPQLTVPLSMSTVWGRGNTRLGGYEMRDNGISMITSATTSNIVGYVRGYNSVSELGTSAGTRYWIAKMLGSEATSDSKSKDYYKKRYYYRADKNTLNQVLPGNTDAYIDKNSYKLNSTGYVDAVSHFGLKDKDKTFSLTEMYVAIKGDTNNNLQGLYSEEHVALIKAVLNGEKGKVSKIICKGMASSQSSSQRSNSNQSSLAKNRASTIQKWLKENLKCSDAQYSQEEFKVSKEKTSNKHDANDKIAKITRMAFVEIHYETEETVSANETDVEVTSGGTTNTLTDAQIAENRQIAENSKNYGTGNFTLDEDGELLGSNSNLNEVVITGGLKNKVDRYDNEAQFFNKLKANDPFMERLLSERIKFFNPAFHSMSPEGFNARLTFLNQCTRQGPTISHSDTNGGNADNLAFGRPPICVLRVGDFYNTKIIISSLNIEYDPLTWDLNEEGIGVMPMIANVSITFNFIGGSELGGPVQRLQNALSFNYYANASVYDNRAEQINYGELGAVDSFKPYTPSGEVISTNS